MDVSAPKITPFTLNLEVEELPFGDHMGICPMLGDVDVPIGTISTKVNDEGGCTWCLDSPFEG
jgi:hypothetical protein